MPLFIQEPSGVLLILPKPETPQEIVSQLVGLNQLQGENEEPVAIGAHDPHFVLRTHGIDSQILTDLCVRKMRVLMRVAPTRIQAISGFDLEVVDSVQFEARQEGVAQPNRCLLLTPFGFTMGQPFRGLFSNSVPQAREAGPCMPRPLPQPH